MRVRLLTTPYFQRWWTRPDIAAIIDIYNTTPRGQTYMQNTLPDFRGELCIEGPGQHRGPDKLTTTPIQRPRSVLQNAGAAVFAAEGLSFSAPGFYTLAVVEPTSGISGRTNPIRVTAANPVERLFWGDIHCHTFFTDGLRSPEQVHDFARNRAFLDVFALADHSETLTDRMWEYFCQVTNDYNDAGRFVTLAGFEWTHMRKGHRNVYYPGDTGALLRSHEAPFSELPALFDHARQHGAIVVPHHSASHDMGVSWDSPPDPEVERLVETDSIWGNSDRPAAAGNTRPIRIAGGEKNGQHVFDALALGRRYGIIGSGDIHDGRPGDDLHSLQDKPDIYRSLYRQGIMGVWARDLTREAVFDALWNRRCYATSNVRLLLDFSINGVPMGGQLTTDGDLLMRIEAAAETAVRLEIVENGKVIESIDEQTSALTPNLRLPNPRRASWYMIRATRSDGEMAWSSPIWVEPGTEVTRHGNDAMADLPM